MLQKNKTLKYIVLLLFMSFLFLFNAQKVLAYDYNTVLSDLESLENLAEEYKSENGLSTDTRILITSYIRDGVYDSTWNQYGTTVDSNFVNYINEKNSSLSYLKNVFTMTTSSGDTIDFKRLISDLDIMYTKGSLFGSWVSDIYDLTMAISSSNETSDKIASSYYNSFSSAGCLTNIDAFNIYKKNDWKLSSSIRDYYNSLGSNNRYIQFTNNLGVSNITKEALRTSTLANFRNCSEIITLLGMRGISYDNNRNIVEGASFAFADYIFEKHPNKQYNTSLSFNEKDFNMTIGEEAELTINVEPKVDSSLLTLTSSAPDVVSIVSGNTVRAISAGEAVISCSYQGATGSVKINVLNKIEKIEFKETKKTIQAGTADKLEPVITPSGNLKYSFKSSDPTVVDIDQSGNVFSLKAGTAKIYCISNENPEIKAEMEINVIESIQEILLKEEEISLRKGESRKLALTITPESYTDKLIYNSLDNQIASIDTDGTITARKEGETTISCYPESNPELIVSCKITVTKGIEKLAFNPSFVTIDLKEGNTYKMNLESTPLDIDVSELSFEISDKKMISLNPKTMTITVSGHGSASITVRSKEDTDIYAKLSIYVLDSEDFGNKKKEDTKPTPNKEVEINTKDIVDKADLTVDKKTDTSFFNIDFQKVILIIVVVSIILVILGAIISEFVNRGKGLGFKLGFRENFNEDAFVENNNSEYFEYRNEFKNAYKIRHQSEEDALKLEEELETEYEERMKKQKEENSKKEQKIDADLLFFDKKMEEQRGKEIKDLMKEDGLLENDEDLFMEDEDKKIFDALTKDDKENKKEEKDDLKFFSADELRNELRDSLKD